MLSPKHNGLLRMFVMMSKSHNYIAGLLLLVHTVVNIYNAIPSTLHVGVQTLQTAGISAMFKS